MSDVQKRLFEGSSCLQQQMLIVFSEILRRRKYYDDKHFIQHQMHGVTVFLIDWSNPFVDHDISTSILGAATAADLQYVRTVQMLFKLINDGPERFVERYAICFDEMNVPELVSPNHRRSPLSKTSDQCWSKEAILEMLQSVEEICGDLDDLPPSVDGIGGFRVSFRVDYNDKSPKGYQAPHFEPSGYRALYFSHHLPSPPVEMPQPKRALSGKENAVRSTLSVQSMLTRRNSAPCRVPSIARTLHVTETDISAGSPCRTPAPPFRSPAPPPIMQRVAAATIPPPEDPQLAILGEDEDEEVEEMETTRDDGRERKRRSIFDEDEEDQTKKSRLSMSEDSLLNRLGEDSAENSRALLHTSLELGDFSHSTIRRSIEESSEAPSKESEEKEDSDDDNEKEEDEEEEEEEEEDKEKDGEHTDQEDPNLTVDSDEGEPFFIE